MNKVEITVGFIVLLLIGIACYYMGYAAGATDTFTIIVKAIPEMLDIELTPRAKMVMDGNPDIIRMAFTQESLHKLLSDYNLSANLKGGIGPGWNLYSGLGETSMKLKNSSET